MSEYGLYVTNNNNIPQLSYSDSMLCLDNSYVSSVMNDGSWWDGYAMVYAVKTEMTDGILHWVPSLSALIGLQFQGTLIIRYDGVVANLSCRVYLSESDIKVFEMKLSNSAPPPTNNYGIIGKDSEGNTNIDSNLKVSKIVDVIRIPTAWNKGTHQDLSIAFSKSYTTPVFFVFAKLHNHVDPTDSTRMWNVSVKWVNNTFQIIRELIWQPQGFYIAAPSTETVIIVMSAV